MRKSANSITIVVRLLVTIVSGLVFILAIRDFSEVARGTMNWVGKFTLTWGIPLAGLMAIGVLAFLWGLLSLWFPSRTHFLNAHLAGWRERLGWLRWPFFVVLAVLPARIFLYTPIGFKLPGTAFRCAFFGAAIVVMAILATHSKENLIRWRPVLLSTLLAGCVFAFGKELVNVSDYPLSLTWSEGNRIWDYSVLYGRRLYDYPLDQKFEAYIDPGRQSLWGLPFLLPNVTILQVRLWSALIFTVPYALLGWMVIRAKSGHLKEWAWFGLWVFLFLYQGPIYTPLVLSAILVAGAWRGPAWLALPLIYLAGYYAQLSRLTWMFAPAVWATMLVLIDSSASANGRLGWRTWLKAGSCGLAGFLGGFGFARGWARLASYFGGIAETEASPPTPPYAEPVFSGSADVVETVSSSGGSFLSDQPFLWERLWPNPTNGLGIVLSLLLAVSPLILLIIFLVRTQRWKLSWLQQVVISGALLAFLGIGVVISVKIGGGSNLHNLDMFLIGLVFVAGVAWELGAAKLLADLERQDLAVKMLFVLLVMIPALMPLVGATPIDLPEQKYVDLTLDLIKTETERVISEGGEVLFMDQRQLLTFGVVDAPLVPEYEKKLVMDRALAGDAEYFTEFYNDLADQRFSLIITDPQRIRYADEDEEWGAENDAWVQWVTEPLFCYYTPKFSKDKTAVWFFVPLEEIEDCAINP